MAHSNIILITAFEPFGGSESNMSLDTLLQLSDIIEGVPVRKLILPVSFVRAPQLLSELVSIFHPALLIMLGQCPVGEKIRLERYAHNLMDAKREDNDGATPVEETIYEGAPIAYRCPLPIKQLCTKCEQDGLPITVSNTAGLYVCNRLYYEALHQGFNALFVHIPKDFDLELAVGTVHAICYHMACCNAS